MPNPLKSLVPQLPAAPAPQAGQTPFQWGKTDMPGSAPKPWPDYPIEALLGFVGVGANTRANQVGQMMSAATPFVGAAGREFRVLHNTTGEVLHAAPTLADAQAYVAAHPTPGQLSVAHPQVPAPPMTAPMMNAQAAATDRTTGHFPEPPGQGLSSVGGMKPYPMPPTGDRRVADIPLPAGVKDRRPPPMNQPMPSDRRLDELLSSKFGGTQGAPTAQPMGPAALVGPQAAGPVTPASIASAKAARDAERADAARRVASDTAAKAARKKLKVVPKPTPDEEE